MTARLLLHALPADTAATDAAALAAAVGDLGALATVMVCATVVLVFVARGAFAYLTAREERLKAQPPQRTATPPAGTTVSAATLHADLRALEERVRSLESAAAGTRVGMAALQDELRRDLASVKESQERATEAIGELSQRVAALTAQLSAAVHGPAHSGQPKTGG